MLCLISAVDQSDSILYIQCIYIYIYIERERERERVQFYIYPLYMYAPAAAVKSLQSCPTLCDPIDGSPPGSPVPGFLQA